MQRPPSTWTTLSLLQWSTSFFESHHIDSPRATAELLLAHVLGKQRIDLYTGYDQPLSTAELHRYKQLILRRINREPVAYILGEKEFWGLPFFVSPDVLIPRPDSECLVENALNSIPDACLGSSRRILELGAGSGAIILALASERPGHMYFAGDRSVKATVVAKRNARRNKLEQCVQFFSGDWFEALKASGEPFDMILSNPPYIPAASVPRLQPEIHQFEPRAALDGGENGLACIGHLISGAFNYLKKDGRLLLEIGYDQKEAVREIIRASNRYDQVVFYKDYAGHDRVVQMRCCRDKTVA